MTWVASAIKLEMRHGQTGASVWLCEMENGDVCVWGGVGGWGGGGDDDHSLVEIKEMCDAFSSALETALRPLPPDPHIGQMHATHQHRLCQHQS